MPAQTGWLGLTDTLTTYWQNVSWRTSKYRPLARRSTWPKSVGCQYNRVGGIFTSEQVVVAYAPAAWTDVKGPSDLLYEFEQKVRDIFTHNHLITCIHSSLILNVPAMWSSISHAVFMLLRESYIQVCISGLHIYTWLFQQKVGNFILNVCLSSMFAVSLSTAEYR